jgi:hypothetical protein
MSPPAATGRNAAQAEQSGASASDQVTKFMARVVPWPTLGGAGFVNLHWTRPGKEGFAGRPYTNVADFMSMVRWCATHPQAAENVYFCMSRQQHTGKVYGDTPTAARSQKYAVALNALWLDVDVKSDQPGKAYPTTDAAVTALEKFLQDTKLPPPTAFVLSGSGGMHLYWISKTPLTPEEWKPYALGLDRLTKQHGFLSDPGITTDSARVLRVPGTSNHKKKPPTACRLVQLGDEDYDFAKELAHILVTTTGGATTLPPFDPTNFNDGPPKALADLPAIDLSAGIYNDTPLDYAEILVKCPHFQDAYTTGGREFPQGLWMLDVLATTFLQDGSGIAHLLSKGYPMYSRAETDAMFDRKLADRQSHGLGWPSCTAFENAGCKSCAQCPHKGKIKSPLNFASRIATTAPGGVTAEAKKQNNLPVAAIRTLYKAGAAAQTLFAELNKTYAVVRYGSDVLIAGITGPEILLMELHDFHKMFGDMRFQEGNRLVEVSRLWLKWEERCQYLGRGIVFDPGGPLEVPDDMLNLWRGFGIEPRKGDWSLMRNHIFNVVCSRKQEHYNYLLNWMAYAVQHPSAPIGVAVAFRGAQGAGKGVVARTFGKFFGKHFAHIANGEQLTGRFNASLATSCAVFLDEALWAGDKKGEGVLKALITEPRLQLEAKFRDPIMVENRLRIMVASNNDWMVPAGIGDRRWFVLDVADTYAGTTHKNYWDALYAEIENGGALRCSMTCSRWT